MGKWYAGVLHPITDTEFRVFQACVAAVKQQQDRGEEVLDGANAYQILEATGLPMGAIHAATQSLNYHHILLVNVSADKSVRYRPHTNAVVEARAETPPTEVFHPSS
jgi:hypothetical protein